MGARGVAYRPTPKMSQNFYPLDCFVNSSGYYFEQTILNFLSFIEFGGIELTADSSG